MTSSERKVQDLRWLAAMVMGGALIAGCSGWTGTDGMAPVSGRVTYAGRPVTAGRVLFYPEDGRRMAMGAIDASGNYTLTTFENQDGAFVGKHKVVIDAVRELSPGPQTPDEESQTAEARVERLVPAIYAERKTSPLEAEVLERGNTIDFDIPADGAGGAQIGDR